MACCLFISLVWKAWDILQVLTLLWYYPWGFSLLPSHRGGSSQSFLAPEKFSLLKTATVSNSAAPHVISHSSSFLCDVMSLLPPFILGWMQFTSWPNQNYLSEGECHSRIHSSSTKTVLLLRPVPLRFLPSIRLALRSLWTVIQGCVSPVWSQTWERRVCQGVPVLWPLLCYLQPAGKTCWEIAEVPCLLSASSSITSSFIPVLPILTRGSAACQTTAV